MKIGRRLAMARETEGSDVVEVALTSTFGDWTNVISIPERSAGGDGFHSVEAEARNTSSATGTLESVVDVEGISGAGGANAAIAREDLVAEVAGVGAKTPLVDTVVGAKSATAFGENLEVAPTAEREIIGAARQNVLLGTATG